MTDSTHPLRSIPPRILWPSWIVLVINYRRNAKPSQTASASIAFLAGVWRSRPKCRRKWLNTDPRSARSMCVAKIGENMPSSKQGCHRPAATVGGREDPLSCRIPKATCSTRLDPDMAPQPSKTLEIRRAGRYLPTQSSRFMTTPAVLLVLAVLAVLVLSVGVQH